MATTVSLLGELLECIFQENRELLLELNVANVISACKRENPAISALDVDPGSLGVNSSGVREEPDSVMGLVSMIFTVKEYLEVFVGRPESEKRMSDPISKFMGRPDAAILSGIRQQFPDLFSMGASAPGKDMKNLGELDKFREIFVNLLKAGVSDSSGGGQAAVSDYLTGNPMVISFSPDLSMLELSPDLSLENLPELFSGAVEHLGISRDAVTHVLAVYGSLPDELGITSGLFGGALSRTSSFGCASVDSLLRDGLLRGDTILLEGPAGAEKEVLASMFIKEGIRKGGCAIIVSSACSPQCIRQSLESPGLDMAAVESEGRLIVVDWHSRFTQRITSIDTSGHIINVSNDLTNLAVAIDMALKRAGGHPHSRLFMDIASPTIITEGFDRVHDFLNSVRARMKNHQCSGLILLNPDMHQSEQVSMLEDIFDGTMEIDRAEQHGKIQSSFRIKQLSGVAYSGSRLTMAMTQRGLEITDGEGMAPEVLGFDQGGERAPMGFFGIESLCSGGLPLGKSYLIWVPSLLMASDIVKPVLSDAQTSGHALLLALSTVDSETLGEWMAEKGLSCKGLIDRGLLQIIDWYSQKSAKVLGMEADQGVIRTSRDLTHLGVGMDMGLRKIGEEFTSVAVLEHISQAVRLFESRSMYSFVQSENAKLLSRGFTVFSLMERNAHDPWINAAAEELFDGIIDIRSSGSALEFAIVSLRGCHSQSEYRPLTKARDRLTVDVSRTVSDQEIVESISAHGMSARLNALEKELRAALEDKQALERRVRELSDMESEYEFRHEVMMATLTEVEARLREASVAPVDALHRDEMSRLLKSMDDMLDKLPEDVIESFARSEDFKLYEKMLSIYLEGDG